MATVSLRGKLFGTGGGSVYLSPDMWQKSDTGLSPDLVRTKTGGTYTNCSQGGNLLVTFSNPTVDTDDYSIFEIEWSDDGATWYSAPLSYVYVWHAISITHITTSLIKTNVGASINLVNGLEIAGLINPYAEFKPDGYSPSKMGEWKRYAHGTQGGLYLYIINGDISVQGTPDGGTVVTGKLSCVACKYFFPLTGTSWQYCKMWIELNGSTIIETTYDLRSVDYPLLESSAISYNGISGSTLPVHFHYAMSNNGTDWTNQPPSHIGSGSVYNAPPIFESLVSNWTATGGANKIIKADLWIKNNSTGNGTVFQIRQRVTSTFNPDPEEVDEGVYSTISTLDNGAEYNGSQITMGAALSGVDHYKIELFMRAGISGTEYFIGEYTYI